MVLFWKMAERIFNCLVATTRVVVRSCATILHWNISSTRILIYTEFYPYSKLGFNERISKNSVVQILLIHYLKFLFNYFSLCWTWQWINWHLMIKSKQSECNGNFRSLPIWWSNDFDSIFYWNWLVCLWPVMIIQLWVNRFKIVLFFVKNSNPITIYFIFIRICRIYRI